MTEDTIERDSDLEPWAGGQEIPLLAWGLLRQVFTVETIMTPRRDLLTGEQGTDLAPVRAEARRRHFDLLPLTHEGRIVEVLRVEDGKREPSPIAGWSPGTRPSPTCCRSFWPQAGLAFWSSTVRTWSAWSPPPT